MVFDYHGYALGPGGDNFPDGRNFIQRGHGRAVNLKGGVIFKKVNLNK